MFKLWIPAIAGVLMSVYAHAERAPLIRVTAPDSFPGEEYFLGLNLNDRTQAIEGIYYQDDYQTDSAKKLRNFTLEQTGAGRRGIVLFNTQGYDVIFLKTFKNSDASINVKMIYRRNVLLGTENNVEFKISKNAGGIYQVTNEEFQHPLREAQVTKGKFGIKRIELKD